MVRVYGSVIIHGCILRHLSVIIDELWEIHPTIVNEDTQTFCRSCTQRHIRREHRAQGLSLETHTQICSASQSSHSINVNTQVCIAILVRKFPIIRYQCRLLYNLRYSRPPLENNVFKGKNDELSDFFILALYLISFHPHKNRSSIVKHTCTDC